MPERRYSHYKQADVWATLYQQQAALQVQVHDGTVHGNSVSLSRHGVRYRAVVLARASDWYHYSLNCVERWRHDLTCIVAGTHDTCVNLPVVALDTLKWYAPLTTRLKSLDPKQWDSLGRPNDSFERWRKGQYGHNIFLGALMCGREDALKRLVCLPDSTRRRIEAKLQTFHLRRPGRPLTV